MEQQQAIDFDSASLQAHLMECGLDGSETAFVLMMRDGQKRVANGETRQELTISKRNAAQ